MVKPPSRLWLPRGYNSPTMVEMFGLKKPFPTMSKANATKNQNSLRSDIRNELLIFVTPRIVRGMKPAS